MLAHQLHLRQREDVRLGDDPRRDAQQPNVVHQAGDAQHLPTPLAEAQRLAKTGGEVGGALAVVCRVLALAIGQGGEDGGERVQVHQRALLLRGSLRSGDRERSIEIVAVEPQPEGVIAAQPARLMHELRVEGAAGMFGDGREEAATCDQRAGVCGDDGIDHVGDGDQATGDGDRRSLQRLRIPVAVPALVVRGDSLLDGPIEAQLAGHLGPSLRVGVQQIHDCRGIGWGDLQRELLGRPFRLGAEHRLLAQVQQSTDLRRGRRGAGVVE